MRRTVIAGLAVLVAAGMAAGATAGTTGGAPATKAEVATAKRTAKAALARSRATARLTARLDRRVSAMRRAGVAGSGGVPGPTGPPGPAGPAGPQGPPGEAALADVDNLYIHWERVSTANAAGPSLVTASCPPGYRIITGGFAINFEHYDRVHVTASYPSYGHQNTYPYDMADAWWVNFRISGEGDVEDPISAKAVCLKP